MRLNRDLSFYFVAKTWELIKVRGFTIACLPFVCPFSQSSLLVKERENNGIILKFNELGVSVRQIPNLKVSLACAESHGFLSHKGNAVGFLKGQFEEYGSYGYQMVKFNNKL